MNANAISNDSKLYLIDKIGVALYEVVRLLPPMVAMAVTKELVRYKLIDPALSHQSVFNSEMLRVKLPGIGELDHPIGIGAGLIKDSYSLEVFKRFGFSFLEMGTITAKPEEYGKSSRGRWDRGKNSLFIPFLQENRGAQYLIDRLKQMEWGNSALPVGINIGKGKEIDESLVLEEYIYLINLFRGICKYFVINIDSWKLGCSGLNWGSYLRELSAGMPGMMSQIWVKFDPGFNKRRLQELIEVVVECGYQGVVLTNAKRDNTLNTYQCGQALGIISTSMLEWAYEVHKGKLYMIASGGVTSGSDIYQKMIRGASSVQFCSALFYRGPWAVVGMLKELVHELKSCGVECLSDIIGSYYR